MIEAPTGNIGYSKVAGHRAEDTPVGYKRTEVGLIPEDWSISTVGAEFRVQLGKMLDAAKNQGVSKPYVGNRSIQWGHVNVDAIETVSLTPVELNRFLLRRGDLLVCEGGEIGRAAIWNDPIPECYYQKALHRLRPIRGYNSLLMMFLLRLWATTGFLTNFATRTSIAHLPKENFETIPLPVPLDHEQRAIVEALSDVEKLLESLDALIAKKRAIKQAAMQQLLMGKTRLPGVSGEWRPRRLGDLAEFYKGSFLSKSDLSIHGKRRCIHYGELFTRYRERIDDGLHGTNREEHFRTSERNDVLMPTSDVTPTGLATASCILRPGVIIGGDILIIRAPAIVLNGVFLAYMIRAQRNQVMQLVSGTTVFHIRACDMATFRFLAPDDIEEQDAIVAVLTDMDTEINALERHLDKTSAIKEGMMQQLLTGRVRLVEPEFQPAYEQVSP